MKSTLVAALILSAGGSAWAQDWSPLDARSRALGGAGVAFADGRADSLYWNPASLAVGSEKLFDFSTGFSFSLSVYTDTHVTGGLAADVTHILDMYDTFDLEALQNNFNSATPTFTAQDVQNVAKVIDSISHLAEKGKGVLTEVGTGFNLRVGPFGLFVHGQANVGALPIVDFSGVGFSSDPAAFFGQIPAAGAMTPAASNLSVAMQGAGLAAGDADKLAYQAQQALGDAAISDPAFINAMTILAAGTQPGSSNTFYDNPSGMMLRAVAQVEAGISLALPVLPTLLDVGVSFKEVISETSFTTVTFADKDSEDKLSDRIKDDLTKDNRKRTTKFNMDLGVRGTPFEWLTLGLAARNIIPMDLAFAGPGGKIHMDPQVRFGAMVRPINLLRLGFDVDLMENESPVLPGYTIRHFGAGAEINLSVLKIRVGYDDNLAFSKDHGRLCAGLGLDFFGYLLIDIGVQASLTKTEIQAAKVDGSDDARTIPSDRVSAGVSIGVNLPF
ncbi:MAG TPA: conjugal transfer protein TraF [Planctomycetota bacterium]|nr:conjugal transfer protein TraF [Planctomycetota bacterium]